MKNIYEELRSKTEKHVKSYLTDFDHDRAAIEKNPGAKFIHITRKHGTHISIFYKSEVFPKAGERVPYLFSTTANREELLKSCLETLQYYIKEDPQSAYYFDGKTLKKIKVEQAEPIYTQYVNDMRRNWEQEERAAQLELTY